MGRATPFKILAACLLLPLWCAAVEPYTPLPADPMLEPWRWQHMEDLDGLGVICMDEAPDGTLWFGAAGSLIHYNGYDYEQIPFDDKLLSIISTWRPVSWGNAVMVSRRGDLLAVVGKSLVSWSEGEWEVIIQDLDPANFDVQLMQGADGVIWLQTRRTLWRISEDLQDSRVVYNVLGESRLTACLGRSDSLWVVESEGKERLLHILLRNGHPVPESEWEVYPTVFSTGIHAAKIMQAQDGRIWYVDNTSANGIMVFDPVEKTWSVAKSLEHSHSHYSLMQTKNGTIWTGGAGELHALDPEGARFYPPRKMGLPIIPLTLYETMGGRLWILSRFGKVYAVDVGARQWRTYPQLHFQCDSPDGVQWFLARNRTVVMHDPAGSRWLRYVTADGLIEKPSALFRSSQGLIWAVGSHQGAAAFSVFDGTQWKRFRHPEFAKAIGPRSFFEALDRTVWFGTNVNEPDLAGGALQYEVTKEKTVRFLKIHGEPEVSLVITGFAQTSDGVMWMGDNAIRSYNRATRQGRQLTELPWCYTDDLVLDAAQSLWVAKSGFGVFRLQENEWKQYGVADGLASDMVSDLLPLHDGTLLAATDSGISRFDGVSWMRNTLPSTITFALKSGTMNEARDRGVWLNFTPSDWLMRGRAPASALGPHTEFCTVKYTADPHSPDTQVTEFLTRVAQPGNSHIRWSGRDLWANTPTDQLEYSWRMNAGAWSPFSPETSKTFLNLDSGKHVLEVRARDRDFNMDPTPARVEFSVTAPLWMQPWFIAMVLLFGCGVAAFFWMMLYYHDKQLKDRQRHLVEMDRIKTGVFTNISHELNTPLMLIIGPLERILASEANAEKKTMLSMAVRNVNRIANLVTQMLDFRKLEEGKMKLEVIDGDMVPQLRETLELLEPLAVRHKVTCRLEGVTECRGWFDPEKLKKITHNLIGNAIKYTPAGGRVRVVLDTRRDKDGFRLFSLTVEDTGRGIKPEHLKLIFERFYRIPEKSIVDGSGIGLNLAKELVELWGGEICAESPIHEDEKRPGTRFSVLLPIERERLPAEGISDEG